MENQSKYIMIERNKFAALCPGTPQMPADAEYPDLRAYRQGKCS